MRDAPVPNVVLLSTADWDATVWTNKQHTARSLARLGSTVLYVESMGLRQPTLHRADVGRIVRRAIRLLSPPRLREPGIYVWSPPSIPFQRYSVVRAVNRLISSLCLSVYVRTLFGSPALYWTYNPLTLALLRIPKAAKIVYHCVDNIGEQPGMPATLIEKKEQELVQRADLVSVTSRALQDRWSELRSVNYEPNVVDRRAFEIEWDAHSPLRSLPENRCPVIGFVGAVAAYKLDLDLIWEIADAHPEWSIRLVGPEDPAEDQTKLKRLSDKANIKQCPAVPYGQVPHVMRSFDVGIIPAAINEYTKSMFPMKFFEYLAAGLPVVATDLDALREFSDLAFVVPRDRFVRAVEAALVSPRPEAEVVELVLDRHSYDGRTRRILSALADSSPVSDEKG